MGLRALKRREEREKKKDRKKGETITTYAPVTLTPGKLAEIRKDILKDLRKQYSDQDILVESCKESYNEGYDAGFHAGEKYSNEHYLKLTYICIALALSDIYHFGQKRIMAVWEKASDKYSEVVDRMEAGEDLEDIEKDMNNLLDERAQIKLFNDDELEKGES